MSGRASEIRTHMSPITLSTPYQGEGIWPYGVFREPPLLYWHLDSNQGPPACDAGTLPLSYASKERGHEPLPVRPEGVEPPLKHRFVACCTIRYATGACNRCIKATNSLCSSPGILDGFQPSVQRLVTPKSHVAQFASRPGYANPVLY